MLRRNTMIPIKSADEIQQMRESCRIAACVLDEITRMVAPGINTYDLDQEGKRLIASFGAHSACFGYRVGSRSYPAYTCLSVNEEVVHGIGSLHRVLREGDIITIDVCVVYRGFVGDNARTVAVGTADPKIIALLRTTEEALFHAIEQAREGNRVGDVSHAVQQYCERRGYSIIRDFVGHGVGRTMHEDPQIPNFGAPGRGDRLHPGMTLAIEPMVALGRPEIEMCEDGWTAVTRDRAPSAHYEHTVLLTDDRPEILTIPKK